MRSVWPQSKYQFADSAENAWNWKQPPGKCPVSRPRHRPALDGLKEQIQEGEGYLEGQACYRNLATNLRVFDGIFRDKSRSTLITNELKYDIRKFCETLSEVREIAAYGSDIPGLQTVRRDAY